MEKQVLDNPHRLGLGSDKGEDVVARTLKISAALEHFKSGALQHTLPYAVKQRSVKVLRGLLRLDSLLVVV